MKKNYITWPALLLSALAGALATHLISISSFDERPGEVVPAHTVGPNNLLPSATLALGQDAAPRDQTAKN
jgi:hypothetical protein